MNKNDVARQINCTMNISRVIIGDFNEDSFVVGEIYDNRNQPESWGSVNGVYYADDFDGVEVLLSCDNVPCHKVNYDDAVECEILGCENCQNEDEYLVAAETKMKIKYVSFQYKDEYNQETGEYETGDLLEIHVELELA